MASQFGGIGRSNRFVRVLGMALAVVVVAALFSPVAEAKFTIKDKVGEDEIKLQIYGFSQLEMRGGEGYTFGLQEGINSPLEGSDLGEAITGRSRADNDGLFFSSQRIRVGFNYFNGKVAGKLFLDFNQPHERLFGVDAGMPRMIKDAFVAYRWNNAAFIRLGMIKTPLGMDFTIPGWNLDIIQRSLMEKGLVLERQAGLMLSGRLIGQGRWGGDMKTNGLEMGNERQGKGFGYDIGIFNPAARSFAVRNTDDIVGDGNSYVGRLHWDWGKPLHVELAYGISEKANGGNPLDIGDPNTVVGDEDYSVMDLGVASELYKGKLELKGEYIMGSDIRGIAGYDQSTIVLTAGYLFADWGQVVVKTYQSEVELAPDPNYPTTLEKSKLGNTYLGLNFYFQRLGSSHRDLQRNKIVVNYVFVNGDGIDESGQNKWYGLGGYVDDVFGLQWQYKF